MPMQVLVEYGWCEFILITKEKKLNAVAIKARRQKKFQ